MRWLLVIACLAGTATAEPSDDCGLHGCPVPAGQWYHPLTWNLLHAPGGPMLGVAFGFRDGDPDPDSVRWSVGVQLRGDVFGAPAHLGSFIDVLYSLRVQHGAGETAVIPEVELAHASLPMMPILGLGLGLGAPIVSREVATMPALQTGIGLRGEPSERELQAGVGLYLHQHWFVVVDSAIGVEIYPTGTEHARAVWTINVTL